MSQTLKFIPVVSYLVAALVASMISCAFALDVDTTIAANNNTNSSSRLIRRKELSNDCPPEGFQSRPTLNLETYISALWYPQKAAPVIYAMDKSYCSVVEYTADDTCTFFCGDNIPRINVRNRGLDGSITGSLNDARLNAMVPDPDKHPAQIRVGFPQRFITPANYWVVDAGLYRDIIAGNHSSTATADDDSVYEWAIISGGAPTRSSNGKCIAGTFGRFDTRGLWIFARDSQPPEGAVQAIDDYAASLGLDTSVMIPVEHEGCDYAFLKD